eukprot:CAMPEP_0179905874 /NCGR_PEP_ID=MMETSP0982-20121206/42882_1 /TAXON_ID=483367 /ORGANISM="non described non described, Strain CCMP 2436" /LENGTH=123 /DNA_ID=CAMNT_0021806221 /DNA_START=43 /DNA_END=414 /DNA_ORIENTATION=+
MSSNTEPPGSSVPTCGQVRAREPAWAHREQGESRCRRAKARGFALYSPSARGLPEPKLAPTPAATGMSPPPKAAAASCCAAWSGRAGSLSAQCRVCRSLSSRTGQGSAPGSPPAAQRWCHSSA